MSTITRDVEAYLASTVKTKTAKHQYENAKEEQVAAYSLVLERLRQNDPPKIIFVAGLPHTIAKNNRSFTLTACRFADED